MSNEKPRTGEFTIRKADVSISLSQGEIYRSDIRAETTAYLQVVHGAWICPFCDTAVEYMTINDHVVFGTGGSYLHSNGKTSECCNGWLCKERQKKWHNATGEGT